MIRDNRAGRVGAEGLPDHQGIAEGVQPYGKSDEGPKKQYEEQGYVLLMQQHVPHVSPPNRSDSVRWSVDIRYQDGRQRAKSVREPGFLARSKERPEDVVTAHEGYVRIREAVVAFARETGIKL